MPRTKRPEVPVTPPHHAAYDGAAPTSVVAGDTLGGKVISVNQNRDGRTCRISLDGGGMFPPALAGTFTSRAEAQFAIDCYLATQAATTKE